MDDETVDDVEIPQTEEGARDFVKFIRAQSHPYKFTCAKIVPAHGEASRVDGYELHFHCWGWLRPWKRQTILVTTSLNRVAVIKTNHAEMLIRCQPNSFHQVMLVLREAFPLYQFTFQANRPHS